MRKGILECSVFCPQLPDGEFHLLKLPHVLAVSVFGEGKQDRNSRLSWRHFRKRAAILKPMHSQIFHAHSRMRCMWPWHFWGGHERGWVCGPQLSALSLTHLFEANNQTGQGWGMHSWREQKCMMTEVWAGQVELWWGSYSDWEEDQRTLRHSLPWESNRSWPMSPQDTDSLWVHRWGVLRYQCVCAFVCVSFCACWLFLWCSSHFLFWVNTTVLGPWFHHRACLYFSSKAFVSPLGKLIFQRLAEIWGSICFGNIWSVFPTFNGHCFAATKIILGVKETYMLRPST